MAVDITRSGSSPIGSDPLTSFRKHIASRVFDDYCPEAEYRSLTQHGLGLIGDVVKVQAALDLELERLGAVNERRLLEELESVLNRFTGSDKKLDQKEKTDAMQLVCKARPGFRAGLRHEVAEAAIVTYCRTHSVKVKTGLFSWAVP
jgi:hypothetical protein